MSDKHDAWGLRPIEGDLRALYVANGWWTDESLGQLLATGLARSPQHAIRIYSDRRPWSGTYGEVHSLARRVAGGLAARGVGAGDVVAFQLPNWVEAAATFWAVSFLGAVVVPIVHFYGAKELSYILERTEVKALVAVDRFGHIDHLEALEKLWPSLPHLEHVWVVGDGPLPRGAGSFSELASADPIGGPVAADPDAPALVAYTSGTTSDPKGVVHSHRTIGFEVRQLGGLQSDRLPTLVGAPVGHGIGMLSALLLPVWRGLPIYLIDVWSPPRVLAIMLEEQVSAGSGSTYFLTSLLDDPGFGRAHRALMSKVGLGGSPVPAAVSNRAESLGISIVRSYGSTEHPSITGSSHEEPAEKRLFTDGAPLQGCEVRIIADSGTEAPAGEPGEIYSRGPDRFIGYTAPTLTARVVHDDGWYATGDVGVLDGDGYLTIVDRKQDVIIRGGENVSALEVEDLILQMPGVAECAVVAAPDQRLGEHACALLRMVPGAQMPDLPAIRRHLEQIGLARQKWPEELLEVEDFPRTASGKIQKFVLRDRLRRR